MRRSTTYPVDLLAAIAIVLLADLSIALDISVLRVPLGLVFVLLVPGYALTATLFPAGKQSEEGTGTSAKASLGGLERVALSLGLSIAVVPLIGLALNASPWGIRLAPTVLYLSSFAFLFLGVAWWRRNRLPIGARPRVFTFDPSLFTALTRGSKVATLLLVCAMIAAGGALAYVLLVPPPAEHFTEFYMLGPGGKAEGYPDHLASGATGRIIVGIVPHEGRNITDTLTITLVSGHLNANPVDPANRTFVAESNTTLLTRTVNLTDQETQETPFTFQAPSRAGTYRLDLTLTRDGEAQSYRDLYLWVTVGG